MINGNPQHHIWLHEGPKALQSRTPALCGNKAFDEGHKHRIHDAAKCASFEEWITSARICKDCGARAIEELGLDVARGELGVGP